MLDWAIRPPYSPCEHHGSARSSWRDSKRDNSLRKFRENPWEKRESSRRECVCLFPLHSVSGWTSWWWRQHHDGGGCTKDGGGDTVQLRSGKGRLRSCTETASARSLFVRLGWNFDGRWSACQRSLHKNFVPNEHREVHFWRPYITDFCVQDQLTSAWKKQTQKVILGDSTQATYR